MSTYKQLTILVAAVALLAPTVSMTAQSNRASAVRPGPDLLYWPPASAPQLENTGIWQAEPILISGASAYRRGEFLYQDFLYDDAGADTERPENAQKAMGDPNALVCATPCPGGPAGDYSYPSNRAYAGNAADLVEVRVKLLGDATAIRLTYNTMLEPERVSATLVFGDSASPMPLPFGANMSARGETVVTVHGARAEVTRLSGATGGGTATASVDMTRRQVEVRLPFAAFDPRGRRDVRMLAAVGLWDAAANRYLIPQAKADDTHPGGAGKAANPPAFFNAAFRYDEPTRLSFNGNGIVGGGWKEDRQAAVLGSGDLSPLAATVDFVKLKNGVNDDMPDARGGVPRSGVLHRILASHFEEAQGRGAATSLLPERCQAEPCVPQLAGRLQPYTAYVPRKAPPATGYRVVLALHGSGGNYNTYTGTPMMTELGERGDGWVVLVPDARGPSYWYYGVSLADVFEIWSDAARHYKLSFSGAAVTGASMGGYATYKVAALFPDLFAAASGVIPCATSGNGQNAPRGTGGHIKPLLPSLRHVPMMSWNGEIDPTCRYPAAVELNDELDRLGYRYGFVTLHEFPHSSLPDYRPMTAWFEAAPITRDPAHVTYVVNAHMLDPKRGINPDHAYWVSGLKVRSVNADAPFGTIDVVSHGFGVGDAPALATQSAGGTLVCKTGPCRPAALVCAPGTRCDVPLEPRYTNRSKSWGAAVAAARRNELAIKATNIAEITIDPQRAKVDCDALVRVESDGPVVVSLTGCSKPAKTVPVSGTR
jgi:predicted esterase